MDKTKERRRSRSNSDIPETGKLYHVIDNSQNIIASLVQKINQDAKYQEHITELSNSSDSKDQRMASNIKTTLDSMRAFGDPKNPLFLAKDIGILTGIPHINQIVSKYNDLEKVVGQITEPSGKIKKVILLTKYGIYKIFFRSNSPAANLFSKYIVDIVEEIFSKAPVFVEQFSGKFIENNPELIDAGIRDLNQKAIELEEKYKEERRRSLLLEKQWADERKKCTELQDENDQLDIDKSYNKMLIEQLEIKNKLQLKRINSITEEFTDAIADANSTKELQIIKEKFLKPVYLYILNPKYFKKLLVRSKEPKEPKKDEIEISSDSDAETPPKTPIPEIDIESYERNFNFIYRSELDDNKIEIDDDELLYFCMNLSRNVAKKDKLIHVGTEWVMNKEHYTHTIKAMQNECLWFDLEKITLYQTSIDDIRGCVQEELLRLNRSSPK